MRTHNLAVPSPSLAASAADPRVPVYDLGDAIGEGGSSVVYHAEVLYIHIYISASLSCFLHRIPMYTSSSNTADPRVPVYDLGDAIGDGGSSVVYHAEVIISIYIDR